MRRTGVRVVLVLAVVGPACTASPSAPAETPSRAPTASSATTTPDATPTPTPTGTTAPTASGSPGTSPGPLTAVEVRAPGAGTVLVHGAYPRQPSRCVDPPRPSLTARYPGTLTVERADDGTLSLSLSIGFEDYLRGIAEVPPSWPAAALQAQAIAARSYALASTGWSAEQERLDRAICSTSACQVYGGIPLLPEPELRRWYRAVRATRGQVLVHDGRPAQTFYFSTSNGRTYGNEEVFGGEPLPFLRPVRERDDGASGLSHWRAEVRFEDLATFLDAAGAWPPDAAVTGVFVDGERVLVEGPGASRTMGLVAFRDAVNEWASCLVPVRYPGALPTTIPSRWFTSSNGRRGVILAGRGWGHGVGMVQWGAYGKARRGLSAADILAHYYGGLRPEPYPEPGRIDVQIATGLTSLRIRPSEEGTVVNGDRLEARRLVVTGGERLTLDPAPTPSQG